LKANLLTGSGKTKTAKNATLPKSCAMNCWWWVN